MCLQDRLPWLLCYRSYCVCRGRCEDFYIRCAKGCASQEHIGPFLLAAVAHGKKRLHLSLMHHFCTLKLPPWSPYWLFCKIMLLMWLPITFIFIFLQWGQQYLHGAVWEHDDSMQMSGSVHVMPLLPACCYHKQKWTSMPQIPLHIRYKALLSSTNKDKDILTSSF